MERNTTAKKLRQSSGQKTGGKKGEKDSRPSPTEGKKDSRPSPTADKPAQNVEEEKSQKSPTKSDRIPSGSNNGAWNHAAVSSMGRDRLKLLDKMAGQREQIQLTEEVLQLKKELIGARARVIESTSGLKFSTYRNKDGESSVEIKADVGDEEKYEIRVNILTEALQRHGVLEPIVR